MYYVATPSYERAYIALFIIYLMPVTVIGYQLECCYYSSPKLPGVYIYTVRASIHDINLLLTVT
jgi:hypothetical protein